MRFGLLAVVMIAPALIGCVPSPTPYQSTGFSGGVSATQIDADTVQIVVKGNYLTPVATIYDYVQLKAAEEAIAHDYDGFEIIDDNNTKAVGSYNYGYVGFVPMYSTPTSAYTETATIKMFKGPKPENPPHYWFDAREVEQTLGAKIKPSQTRSSP
jgi:hypothetical protein